MNGSEFEKAMHEQVWQWYLELHLKNLQDYVRFSFVHLDNISQALDNIRKMLTK